jgi:diguanylate cyclase (GGDEF)-like protein
MQEKHNILIVDDEKSNIDILINLFKKMENDYNIIPATSGKIALKAVEKREIDLILLDIMMPEMDGYEVCKILKSKNSTKDIPVLFITSSTDDDSIIKAYNIGASDYVTKPFKPIELLARVKINLQLKKTIEKLEYFAYYDVMTNVFNRRKFFDIATAKFDTNKTNLYAVMIDIDKFKSINDTHGHHIGDKVIKMVAKIIQSLIEDSMLFGRLGGEEFAILIDSKSKDDVFDFVDKIRQKIQSVEISIDEDTSISCTISNGISKYDSSMKTIDHLLQKADEALYEAKDSGRNKTIFRI